MPIDRQAIERRDFPIARRGYEVAAVDAHLQTVAAQLDELQQATSNGGGASLATTAGTHVEGIIHAAETAAAEIERQAREEADRLRAEASADAQATREDAIAKARAHVAAVQQAAATLLERVQSMDGEVDKLAEAVRARAGALSDDLAAVERNMAELYDAAAGQRLVTHAQPPAPPQAIPVPSPPPAVPPAPQAAAAVPSTTQEVPLPPPVAVTSSEGTAPEAAPAARAPVPPPAAAPAGDDLDGARLVALNMALNGESRAETDRYLAENFKLADRGRLVDEVYAAIEG